MGRSSRRSDAAASMAPASAARAVGQSSRRRGQLIASAVAFAAWLAFLAWMAWTA